MTQDRVPVCIAVLTVSDTRDEATDKSRQAAGRAPRSGWPRPARKANPARRHLSAPRPSLAVDRRAPRPSHRHHRRHRGPSLAATAHPRPSACSSTRKSKGFGEVFRVLSYDEIGTATLQSRCVAGVANSTYIFCLPGSSGACATGWDKLIGPQLDSTNQPCNLVDLMPRLSEI